MSKSFEKWWEHNGAAINTLNALSRKQWLDAAYTAGLERAAEIAELMTRECPSPNCSQCEVVEDCMQKETGFCIEAAIRKEAGE